MSGETFVTYGDVQIRHILTHSITQTPVLDQSGTDLLYYKFVVKVSGIIHGQSSWCNRSNPVYPANPSGTSGTDELIGVRVGLPPRKTFIMTVGYPGTDENPSSEILRAEPITGSVLPASMTHRDVKNGPYCTEFNVTKVSGGDVFNVDSTFEIHKLECEYNGQAEGNTAGILSNRWSAFDSIDQNRRLVRNYNGTIVFASNIYNPNMFRGNIVPPLQPRMKRENLSFTISDDGLQMRYSFSDSQVAQAAPFPASHWEVNVSQSASLARIIRREISGILVAPDTATAAELLELAWYIIAAKTYGLTFAQAKAANIQDRAILEGVSFTEHIGEKTSLSFSATFNVGQLTKENLEFHSKMVGFIGQPLDDGILPENAVGYSPYLSDGGRASGVNASGIEAPYVEGPVALATMFLSYLQSACNNTHNLVPNPSGELPSNTNRATDSGPVASIPVYTSPTLPEEDSSYYTANAKSEAYTGWKMSSTIVNNQLKAAMPIASAPGDSSSSPPPASTRVVRLSRPQARRIVRIEAERVGQWPEMPDLDALPGFSPSDAGGGYAGPTQSLLESKQLYALPVVAATGQKVFTVGVEATYALSRAPTSSEFIPVGRSIWNTDGNEVTNTIATKSTAWES